MTPKTPKIPKSEKTNLDSEKDEHVSSKSQSSKKHHDSDKEKEHDVTQENISKQDDL